MELFWEHGYDDVNQQQMVAATGLSTSSLYNTFGTKPQTYREVLARYQEAIAHILEPLEHGTQGREDLHATLDRIETLFRSPRGRYGCLLTCSMTTIATHDEHVADTGKAYRERLRAALTEAMRRGRTAGERLPDPTATGHVLAAALLGMFVTGRATQGGTEALDQLTSLHTLIDSWNRPATPPPSRRR
jgi:AcrR family transcriptional regulator